MTTDEAIREVNPFTVTYQMALAEALVHARVASELAEDGWNGQATIARAAVSQAWSNFAIARKQAAG